MFPISVWVCVAIGTQTAPTFTPKQAVDLAFRHRRSLAAARLDVEAARSTTRAMALASGPRLDLQSASNRELRGNDDDLVLAQPIDLFGRGSARRKVGEAQIGLAEVDLRRTALQVQQEVLDAYGQACFATERVHIATDHFLLVEKIRVATKKRADAGITPPVQVERAAVEAESARQEADSLEASRRASILRLEGALGATQDAVSNPGLADLGVSEAESSLVESQHPDFLELRANGSLLRAEIGRVRSEGRPEFEVSLRTSPWTYRDNQTGVRATFSIPLGNRASRHEVASLMTSSRAHDARLEDLRQATQSELEALKIELAAAKQQLESAKNLGERARQLVRASELGFTEGATSLLEVLESTRSLREVEEGILGARLRLFQAQTSLLTASGTLLVEVAR